jgi:DnaJ-class molecular chaperone
MSNKYRELQIICKECNGTGIKKTGNPEAQEPCMDCEQTGYIVLGRIKFKSNDFIDE